DSNSTIFYFDFSVLLAIWGICFSLPRNSDLLSCSGFDNLKSQLGSFPSEMADLSLAVLGLVEFRSLVHMLHAVAQHTVDQSSQLGLDRSGTERGGVKKR